MDAAEAIPVARQADPSPGSLAANREIAAILAAILRREALPLILQRLADSWQSLYPTRAIAIFLRNGQHYRLEAKAGLSSDQAVPQKPNPSDPIPPELLLNCPAFLELVIAGHRLRVCSSLAPDSAEGQGAIAIFNDDPPRQDDPLYETVRSFCDLARLAIEHRDLQEKVIHQSHYDRLTGLPNRILLEDRLRQALVVARRQGTLVGVACIGLDRFTQINDTLGHETGDAFFKLVSQRLNASIRDIDTLARDDGDEFILTLRDLEDTTDANRICDRILQAFNAPFIVEGRQLTITASMGTSIFPQHGSTPALLLGNACQALHAAKRDGRARAQVYSPGLGRESRRAAELGDEMVNAIPEHQFRIVYQPIYTVTREIVGLEALLRWKHPRRGLISPLEFIPIAEKSGLIVPVGDWVIDEVCRQAAEWNRAGVPQVKLFVNISGVQLARPDFATKIAHAIERGSLPPERLELEITESWIISDFREVANKLQTLRELGVGVAIDDFGTGYSTFNYLHELPLDTLKIDRSFIQRLDGSPANVSTVRTIIDLAKQLGLKTVAEGVECEQHLLQLHDIGCEFVQGFLLARPLKPAAVSALLRRQHPVLPDSGVLLADLHPAECLIT